MQNLSWEDCNAFELLFVPSLTATSSIVKQQWIKKQTKNVYTKSQQSMLKTILTGVNYGILMFNLVYPFSMKWIIGPLPSKRKSRENEMRERQKERVLSSQSAELHTPFCQDLLSSYCSLGMPCCVCQRWARLTVKVTFRGFRRTWACERGRLLHGRFKCFLLSSKTGLML